jgi:hypothetical protein
MENLTAREIVENAKEILIQKNLESGLKPQFAKDLAMYAMFGMLSASVSKKEAKTILALAKDWK